MPSLSILAATFAAYALGCISSAYYIVRVVKGQDIRTLGSGNAGGRNAGRVLGRAGFVAVTIFDALKGLAAVVLARWLGVAGWGLVPVLFAVVAGHIWPVQLGFRGGKGIATTIGALLAYELAIPFILAGIVLVFYVVLRSITLGLMASLVVLPVVVWALGWPPDVITMLGLLAMVLIYANRSNIRARLPLRTRRNLQ